MMKKGIDISYAQGCIDFKKLMDYGIEFAIIRAGYGKYASQKDRCFESNYQNAKAIGLPVGCYWYSYGVSEDEALQEANAFLEAIKDKQFEYPVCFDIEDKTQTMLSCETISKIIETFCITVEKAGYYVSLYSYKNFLDTKVSDSMKQRFDVWVAHTGVEKTTYSGNYGMWQYSHEGKSDGISGNVDLNYAYKDYPSIMKQHSLNGYSKTLAQTISNTVTTFNINDKVKVRSGATDCNGKSLKSFVYKTVYTILQLNSDRAVIGLDGKVTAAVSTANLIKV